MSKIYATEQESYFYSLVKLNKKKKRRNCSSCKASFQPQTGAARLCSNCKVKANRVRNSYLA